MKIKSKYEKYEEDVSVSARSVYNLINLDDVKGYIAYLAVVSSDPNVSLHIRIDGEIIDFPTIYKLSEKLVMIQGSDPITVHVYDTTNDVYGFRLLGVRLRDLLEFNKNIRIYIENETDSSVTVSYFLIINWR